MSRVLTLMLLAATLLVGCEAGPVASKKALEAQAATKARGKGIADAKTALGKGVLLIKEYPPLPSPAEHGDYIKLLKEKCNCDYEVVGMTDTVYTADLIEEVAGWNDVMKAEIRSKHGATIIEDLQTEARKRWEARTQPKGK
jgi:hypothetical protein